MAFTLQVHSFSKLDGNERLTTFNPYKLFSALIEGDSMPSNYYAQGGKWYDAGGVEVHVEDVPEWVWRECRAMNPFNRGMYRILLPEEIAEGKKVPSFDEQEEYPSKKDIMAGLLKLDPANDKHWTKSGLPSLDALQKKLGAYVSRGRLDSVAPAFVRPAQ